MSDNFTPEQIAADREMIAKATIPSSNISADELSALTADDLKRINDMRAITFHGTPLGMWCPLPIYLVLLRFPLALDEIERLQAENEVIPDIIATCAEYLPKEDGVKRFGVMTWIAEVCLMVEDLRADNAAISEALAISGHANDCRVWDCLLCTFPITHHDTGDHRCPCGRETHFESLPCNCYLATLPDAVARGKKLLEMQAELERRDTPVVIDKKRLSQHSSRLATCECRKVILNGTEKFCPHCGKRLEWQ